MRKLFERRIELYRSRPIFMLAFYYRSRSNTCCLCRCVSVDMDASGGERKSFTRILSSCSTKGNVQTDRDQRKRFGATNPAEKRQDESETLFSGGKDSPVGECVCFIDLCTIGMVGNHNQHRRYV